MYSLNALSKTPFKAIDGLLSAPTDKTLLRQKLKKQVEELISLKDGQERFGDSGFSGGGVLGFGFRV